LTLNTDQINNNILVKVKETLLDKPIEDKEDIKNILPKKNKLKKDFNKFAEENNNYNSKKLLIHIEEQQDDDIQIDEDNIKERTEKVCFRSRDDQISANLEKKISLEKLDSTIKEAFKPKTDIRKFESFNDEVRNNVIVDLKDSKKESEKKNAIIYFTSPSHENSINNESLYRTQSLSEKDGISQKNLEKLNLDFIDDKITLTNLKDKLFTKRILSKISNDPPDEFENFDYNDLINNNENKSKAKEESKEYQKIQDKKKVDQVVDIEKGLKNANSGYNLLSSLKTKPLMDEKNLLEIDYSDNDIKLKFDKLTRKDAELKLPKINFKIDDEFCQNTVPNEQIHVVDQFHNMVQQNENIVEEKAFRKYNNDINKFLNSLLKLCSITTSVVEWINKSYTWVEERYLSEYIKDPAKENYDECHQLVNKPEM